MELSSDNVMKTLAEVLYRQEEVTGSNTPDDAIIVSGIVQRFGFHPARLKEKRDDICSMLRELPTAFHKGTGDGYSFLGAAEDRVMEALFCMGIGVGVVTELLPRSFWSVLPGGVPYYGIDVSGEMPAKTTEDENSTT